MDNRLDKDIINRWAHLGDLETLEDIVASEVMDRWVVLVKDFEAYHVSRKRKKQHLISIAIISARIAL